MDSLTNFLTTIGEEVEDAEEESFLLFSQDIPSANLGFVDSRATTIDLTIHDQDYTIHQSPTLLSSSRAGGTTGAVLWKITPLIAEWLSNNTATTKDTKDVNPLWTHNILTPTSTIVELGSGISALLALSLSPKISHYIATDQEYVQRLFRQNLDENASTITTSTSTGGGSSKSSKAGKKSSKTSAAARKSHQGHATGIGNGNVIFTSLDWELDVAGSLKEGLGLCTTVDDSGEEEEDKGFDVVVSCDCIYNDALVAPFVRTCADLCRLRPVYIPPGGGGGSSGTGRGRRTPTVCVIAQQQRSPEVFEAWLRETLRVFRVWRVSDEMLGEKLMSGSGYLVHVLVLR
ncbi:hypothetical protein BO83DRAFT_63886 [Aspergillus eucalypticola CBS 122712]|uniref:Diaminohydroxyphosphoribosylamino-pyrimidine deaminase n=1 Tax=Aspergillus eucalypticola (strain CBS 122712 / IBT 29274) TaxID=1448314 RepID=A0A317VAT9_ASPEC|nr:uncharacterized protein BO83DRAFT_63886 [Aspergillus eucalypticola CBS 122712]PWY70042.1 hypothetical protein BO83DRAFT_63886 [Aspergillus eucalypticola CBS 122712]